MLFFNQHGLKYKQNHEIYEHNSLDTSDSDPYRIAYVKDVKTRLERLLSDGKNKFEWRRNNGTNLNFSPTDSEDFTPRIIEQLLAEHPHVKKEELVLSYEVGMTGKADPVPMRVLKSLILIDPVTGRGQIDKHSEAAKRLNKLF